MECICCFHTGSFFTVMPKNCIFFFSKLILRPCVRSVCESRIQYFFSLLLFQCASACVFCLAFSKFVRHAYFALYLSWWRVSISSFARTVINAKCTEFECLLMVYVQSARMYALDTLDRLLLLPLPSLTHSLAARRCSSAIVMVVFVRFKFLFS